MRRPMQLRADRLAAHLQRGLRARLHRLGRRAAAGAGSRRRDPRRGARRRLQRAPGAHRRRRALRLERPARRGAGAEPVRRPAAGRDPHPVGQARQGRLGGAAALLRDAVAGGGRDVVTLVQLPRLDRTQQASAWFGALDRAGVTVRVDPVERKALPAWIAQRLARAGPARRRRRRRASARSPSSPTGSKATCSPRTRRSRSSRLLYPAGELGFEQIEAAVLNVARYDVFRLGEAVLAGQAARALRMLDGLRSRRRGGGAGALDAGRGHPRPEARQGRARRRQAAAAGAARGARLGRQGARLRARRDAAERRRRSPTCSTPRTSATAWSRACKHPDWPLDPWEALKRLVLLLAEQTARVGTRPIAPAWR